MFSKDSARQADACRFCWMCRHICPVAGATGSEGWTPRARGLMVSMIERGTKYDAEIAEAMYHCTMCDACANDCATGFKPTDFTREARTLAVVNDFAPAAINTEIDNIMNKGNIYGLRLDEKLAHELEKLPTMADTLLYIGQSGRTVAASVALSVISLLNKANVKFTAIKDELPSGAFLGDLMGYTGDVQAIAAKNAEAIKAAGAKKAIVLAPYDAVMLRDMYSKWNLLDGIEIVSATSFVSELIASGALKVGKVAMKASVHEPVKLTRGLEEEKPLMDMVKALGIEYVQLFLHGKMSRCVGTPLMDLYDAPVAKHMVEVRLDDARRLGSNAIITASADDYYIMSKNTDADMKIVDVFTLINENC